MTSLMNWVVALVLAAAVTLLLLALGVPVYGVGMTAAGAAGFAWAERSRRGRDARRQAHRESSLLFQPTQNDSEWRG